MRVVGFGVSVPASLGIAFDLLQYVEFTVISVQFSCFCLLPVEPF